MGKHWVLPLVLLLACGDGGADETTDSEGMHGDDAGQPGPDAEPDAGPDAGAPVCSGCDDEGRNPDDTSMHLHHVHLNVTDRAASMAFYKTHMGAEPVRLNGQTDALRAGAILMLFDEVDAPAQSRLPTALQHVGFGSSDPVAWFDAASADGVAPDTRGHTLFNTNETPTVAGPGSLLESLLGIPVPACFPVADEIAYMYVLGPDDERIEVWSGRDGDINHVHFTTADPDATTAFYAGLFDTDVPSGAFFVDDILFFFEPDGDAGEYGPTEDHVMGHIALSVTDLQRERERLDGLGIEMVSEPARVHGFESFFIRGPDDVLIELVQAAPAAGLCPNSP